MDLPQEIWRLVFSFTDSSTCTSVRLVCQQLNKLLPRAKSSNELYSRTCCLDGHFELFLLSVNWGLPLFSYYYDLAVIGGCDAIFDYLEKRGVPFSSSLARTCAMQDREDLFARCYQQSTGCNEELYFMPQAWIKKYIGKGWHRYPLAWHCKHGNLEGIKKEIGLSAGFHGVNQLISLKSNPAVVAWYVREYPEHSLRRARLLIEIEEVELFTKQIVLSDYEIYFGQAILYRSYAILNLLLADYGLSVAEGTTRLAMLELLVQNCIPVRLEGKALNELFIDCDTDALAYALENNLLNRNNLPEIEWSKLKTITVELLNLLYQLYHNLNTDRNLERLYSISSYVTYNWLEVNHLDTTEALIKAAIADPDLRTLALLEEKVQFTMTLFLLFCTKALTVEACEFIYSRIRKKRKHLAPVRAYSLPVLQWLAKHNMIRCGKRARHLQHLPGEKQSITAWLFATR